MFQKRTSPSFSILTPQNTQLEISDAKTSSKKRVAESLVTKSASKFRVEDEFDPDLSSDIKGIMSALQQIRKKAPKDGQKTNEQTISRGL
ncbi:hypothetical protein OIU84_014201 [Salix udensis]|uniref:Uncharacterized protein n=1 Tax=Salix udensis TaxID=889485 RepID=A0AAD6JCE1_9ROSI|nr:hypothetical protein OIU84_014201 [Salix udensis]